MPNIPSLTRTQVRAVDRIAIEEYGLPGIVLMENAGRGAAEWLMELGVAGPVVVCCGKGNNGGDGFVIARHLAIRACEVRVVLFAPPQQVTGDAAINLHVVQQMALPTLRADSPSTGDEWGEWLTAADWIVDALLGTGTTGEIREPYLAGIAAINSAGRKVLAVDLPSGLDADTGASLGACVNATATATFVARKTGFDSPAAGACLGKVRVIDIGVPPAIIEQACAPETAIFPTETDGP